MHASKRSKFPFKLRMTKGPRVGRGFAGARAEASACSVDLLGMHERLVVVPVGVEAILEIPCAYFLDAGAVCDPLQVLCPGEAGDGDAA